MPLDRAEAIQLIRLTVNAVADALQDAATPGQITRTEWFAIAQRVAAQAFVDVVD